MSTISLNPILRRLAIAAAVLAISTSAFAIADAQFEPALRDFIKATQGDESQIEKSADAFSALLRQEPTNPVLMAYAGAATSMKATTTLLPWKKMSYAEDGMALLDKALAMLTPAHQTALQHGVPAALDVRLVAANTFLAVPGFMNRGSRGAKLLNEVLASSQLGNAPLEFRGAVWQAAAKLAVKENRNADARRFLTQTIQAKAPQAEQARAQLAGLGS